MRESFALKGAMRYLREKHPEEEIEAVLQVCEDLALDLSKTKGYLHPRALAAAASHIYLTNQGNSVTLENTSSSFHISSATLREYLRTYPAASPKATSKKMLENTLRGSELRNATDMLDALYEKLGKRKNTINPAALAAASLYISLYKSGSNISLVDIAKKYDISTSTLRDYIGSHEDAVNPIERAKILLSQYAAGADLQEMYTILEKVGKTLDISTARILAAIAYYLYTIDRQEYITIEKVAREFNVSIPALRSYLGPYLPSLSGTYLLMKRGEQHDLKEELAKLNESEMDLLGRVYRNFGNNIFELSLLFDIGAIPRGRWQLFIRKISKLGLMDIYKKPLDPKQYCALVKGLSEYLTKSESLQRWV